MSQEDKKVVETGTKADIKRVEQLRKRVPLGTRDVLTAPKNPGFVRRFVNDKGNRVKKFIDAGWNIVSDEGEAGEPKIGRASSMGSGTNPEVGSGQRAVLMEIPEEIYYEDKKASQAKITEVEKEMRRNSSAEGQDGLSGKISITEEF